jgi:hypothetical protein
MDLASAVTNLKNLFNPQPLVEVIGDRNYAVKPSGYGASLGELIVPPAKPTLQLISLTGFRDAYIAGIDDFSEAGKTAVQVIDHETVALVSLEADENGQRHKWLQTTNRESNPFPFDAYQVPEAFLLSLQMGFLPTEEVVQLQRFASSLSNESSIATQDDGYTQTVTAKQGSVSRGDIQLPKRIELMPYRTFREIDPVKSEFIVRLKGTPGQLPTIALLGVDAGRWKHDTALLVKYWMVANLPEGTVVIA